MRLGLALVLLSGCATPGVVALRADGSPGPEPCPKAALEAMHLIRLYPGSGAWIDVDINKQNQHNITVNDGPIEGRLQEPMGPVLETSTRLYGRVWTSGPQVVIRYYEAHPPDQGETIPICGVARLSEGQLKQQPGSGPGSAVLEFSFARFYIVDSFR